MTGPPVSRALLTLGLLLSVTWNSAGAHKFSDFKLCADEDCNAIMSHVKALRDYEAPDCRYLSFKAKQRIQVFMKLTGESDSLWAGSCQGKIGFFPKDVVKEVQPFLNAKEIKFPSKERDFRCLDGEYVGEENDSSEDIEDNSAELDSAELAVGNPEVEEFIEDTSSEENIIGSGEDDILAERADLVKPPEKTSTGITATMQGLLSNTGGILGWFSGDKAPSQFETGPAAGDAAGPGDAADLLSHVGDDQQAPPGGNAELASAVAQSPRGDSGDSGAVSSTPGDVAAEHEHEVPTSGDEIAKVPPVPGGFLNNVQSLVSGFNFFGSKPTPDDKPAGTGGIVTSERSEETILKDRSPTSQPIDESQALVEASAPDKPPADASADLSNNANVEVITKDPQLPSAEPLADGNTLVLTEESNGGDISVSPDTSSTGDRGGLSESLDEPMLDVGVGSLPVPWLVSRLDHLLLRASTSVWPSLAPTVTLMVPDWVCPGGVKNVRQFTPLAMAALGALGVSSLLLGFVFRLCSVIKNRRCLSREAKLMCQVAALLQEKSALALEISNCTQKLAAKQDAEEEPLRQAGSSGHVAELRESNAELRRLVAELRSAASQVTAALSDVRSEHRGRLDQASPTRDEEDEEDEEGGENEDLGSKLVEAEHLLAAALSRVDVLAATLQTSIQSRDSLVSGTEQLEVEELRRCREEVAALRRGLEEARSTQAALDTTLAARCSEHQMMSEGLQQLELLGGSALGADGPGGSYPVWASSEHHATNAVLMKATIERVEGETLRLGEQLLSEERATQELRERASALRRECAAVRQDEEQGRRGAEALRVRLQLLTDMHRGTDASLKRELSEKENSGQTKASACSEAEQKALQAMEEATQYKQRVSDLKRELRQTEDSFREQISTQEKDIHEQWFAACKAKRELVEVRKEMSVLQRLSEVKGSATQLVHPTPSRPPTGPPLGAFPPEPTSGLVPDRRRSLPSPGPPQHRGPQHHGSNSSLASSCSLDVDNDGRLAVAPPRRPSSHCGAPLSPPPTLGGSFTEPSPFRPRRGGPLSPLFGAPRWCPAAPWGPLSPPGSDMGPRRNLSPLMDPRMLLPSLPPAAAPLPPPHRGFAQPPRAFPPARSPAPLYGPAPPYDPRHVPCIQGRANQAEGARSQAMSPPPPGPPRKASTPK
ncbi:transport and Golgi organization protein 1 homolog isoform X9 [Lethenteron reissneri]|uniref:transport and Golgi organization protein 1 homolog isoform X9 n=1 Tax=Lethenteron reissneri TaxID=7753 RepID=UPI002AB7A9ED|nr:transport and Golgi organization protein 1 homolog isoform X9 [Lethenteron reissneri]